MDAVWGYAALVKGDLVSEGFELANVAAGLADLVDPAFVPVGSEVGVAGLVVGEQVPDDDQDGPGDGGPGLGGAAAAGDPAIAFAGEGGGAGRGHGGLAEGAAQLGVAVVLAVPGAGAGLEGPRAQPGPGDQVRRGGEPGHVQAGCGDDRGGQLRADAGDPVQPDDGGQRRRVRAGPGARPRPAAPGRSRPGHFHAARPVNNEKAYHELWLHKARKTGANWTTSRDKSI